VETTIVGSNNTRGINAFNYELIGGKGEIMSQ
jgi:hypothetical protein